MGNPKVANMVMLGAYIGVTDAIEPNRFCGRWRKHGMRPNWSR